MPDRDNTLKVLPAPEAKSLRSRENEAAQQFKYVEELCAELELAVLAGNCGYLYIIIYTKNSYTGWVSFSRTGFGMTLCLYEWKFC